MRRAALAATTALTVLLLSASAARAAAPTVGAVSATNIQGVSALLLGSVDPQGLSTTYEFQYVEQAGFEASGFAGASTTPMAAAGSGTGQRPARAAISGLSTDTTYHYRLNATNSDGSAGAEGTFTTSHGFGFLPGEEGFAAAAIADGGGAATVAGSHPYQLSFEIGLQLGGEFEGQPGVPFADGDLRNLRIELPAGLIVNSNILPECSLVDFHTPRSSPFEQSSSGESCPANTQVGTVELQTSRRRGLTRRFGVFNLQPAPGVPAQLGFAPFGSPIVFAAGLVPSPDGSYQLALEARDFPQALDLHGLDLELWGTPWGASHNGERGNCLNESEPDFPWAKCSVGEPTQHPPLAFLTLPASCEGPLGFAASADSWQQRVTASAHALNRDPQGSPAAMGSCGSLVFEPVTAAFLTSTKASSSSGFNFRLSNDNQGLIGPRLRAPTQVQGAVVSLPGGVTLNPSLAEGLQGCRPAGYSAETAFGPQGAGCPNGSKIGSFSVKTPLYDERLEGAIYLAEPDDPATPTPGAENPFDTLLAVYLVARLPQRGVMVKLPGKIVPDLANGRLTAGFQGLPQLPYTDLDVNFRSGQRAPLITPPGCGPATTRTVLRPWAAGLFGDLHASTDSAIATGIEAGPCPGGATPPFAPGAVAGGINSNVNSYTPYFVHLTRRDTEQEITSYSLVLPKGITGKLAGIPFCSDAAIAAARARRGRAETASPSCPAASQVGRTVSGYGVGPALTYAPGRIYLAGPYHGQPLSLVTINAATVGPFDLGTVVIRSAFAVDPLTAQLRIDSSSSDRIPHILEGVPLHLRDIRVYMDRPQFTHNPSSCEPSQMISTLTGSGARFGDPGDDSTATVAEHFQLLNCLTLAFKPKLGLRLQGGSRRGAYPSLRATFAARGPKDSNLKQIEVVMPHSEFLAQNHIRGVCTREQFAADRCPADSAYGVAAAFTPLFDEPLRGEVYLRSSSHRLPDLVASLYSGAVHIVVEGRIGPSKQGGIRTVFSNLPDAPIERFVMRLNGGKRGLLVNSTNICAAPPIASVKALGQNNVGAIFTTRLRGQCGKKHHRGGADE
jgi:hypothetical protein